VVALVLARTGGATSVGLERQGGGGSKAGWAKWAGVSCSRGGQNKREVWARAGRNYEPEWLSARNGLRFKQSLFYFCFKL
jgi:hypothetical protein